jgi:hypothetical protein
VFLYLHISNDGANFFVLIHGRKCNLQMDVPGMCFSLAAPITKLDISDRGNCTADGIGYWVDFKEATQNACSNPTWPYRDFFNFWMEYPMCSDQNSCEAQGECNDW